MRREVLACFVVSLFVMQAWTISGNEFSEIQISKTYHQDQQFNQSGYVESVHILRQMANPTFLAPVFNGLHPHNYLHLAGLEHALQL